MKTKTIMSVVSGAAILISVAGCGGGSGGTTAVAPTGTSKGVITALGSIFVNGIEYSTNSTSVKADKSSGSNSDLKVGRIVTVRGSRSDSTHGSAISVDFRDNVEGPVDVTPAGGATQFQVLGQTVSVNTTAATVAAGKTVFEGFTSLTDLTAGSVVEVSGFPDANGVIQATFIQRKGALTAGTAIEVKGAIANLNTAAKTFTINALTVDYNGASLSNFSGSLSNGTFIEVKGTGAGYTAGVSPTLVATSVENENEKAEGVENENLGVEGFVSGFTSGSNTFKVGGQPVNTGSLSLAGIGNNSKVEVEGTLSGGVLIATKIKPEN